MLLALALDVNMNFPDHDDGTKSTLIYTEAPLIAGVLLGFALLLQMSASPNWCLAFFAR